ncbi:MAG: glutathione S-transferase family protein [Deltaproteobacteria bacterium]|nr:glutathione S-transferase family protein [Deltaproteobacteria bacterium]
MPDVTYYGHWICPFAKRVKFVLANRGIEHDEIIVPPQAVRPKGMTLPPEFLQWSPRREIPMIRYKGHYLTDSIPIMEFLEREIAENPMLPADPVARAAVMERVRWLDLNLMLSAVRVYYGITPEGIATGSRDLAAAFAQMETWLTGQKWLCGSEPTLAEAIAIPIYVRLNGLRRLGFSWDGPGPELARHIRQCEMLRGWTAVAWTGEQEDEFTGRFLKYREIKNRPPAV